MCFSFLKKTANKTFRNFSFINFILKNFLLQKEKMKTIFFVKNCFLKFKNTLWFEIKFAFDEKLFFFLKNFLSKIDKVLINIFFLFAVFMVDVYNNCFIRFLDARALKLKK